MRIEKRIERLERQNRDLKRVMMLMLAGATGTALVAAVAGSISATIALLLTAATCLALIERRSGRVPAVVRAEKIEVVGSDGITRVVLGETVDGRGAVALYDASGKFLVALDSTKRRQVTPASGGGMSPEAARNPFPTARASAAHMLSAPVRASQR